MADGIYVSMCGAAARSDQLESVADNLANVQTRGFKAARPAFEAFLPLGGKYDKSYPAAVATSLDLRPGPSTTTGNPLDVVPEDGAFLAVQTSGGGVAYTRDGRLTLDAERRLVIGGNPVLAKNGQPIVVPLDSAAEVDDEGRVRAVLQSTSERATRPEGADLGQLATFRLSGAVDKLGPALVAPGQGGSADETEDTRFRVGEVELANASPLEAMVQMIGAQRSFEASMQAIQVYRSLDQSANAVGRVK
ncbi:MAG TPA: flagellar hook basal-body protein [Anaeromyxobacteraceae bacterium]|nr:flagellar hook basal-body protein [Anaeromyxobacteraceae bacterium]